MKPLLLTLYFLIELPEIGQAYLTFLDWVDRIADPFAEWLRWDIINQYLNI